VIDLYGRISKETAGDRRQRQFSSPDAQIEEMVAEVERRGALVGKVFKDTSLSAWDRNVVRPDWNELMARAESGASDGMMFFNVSRFSRKIIEGERLLDIARRGLLVWTIHGDYDLTTQRGRSQFRDDMKDAETESELISERTTTGKRRKAQTGRSNASWRAFGSPGYPVNPPGWRPGDPREMVPADVVVAERDVLREIARRLLDGETLDSMTRMLLARGFTTVAGHPWTSMALRQALKRPSIAGYNVYDGEVIGRLAGEPVLDDETWQRIMALFESRKRGRPNSGIYLLSGLMHCGRCGATLYGRPLTGRLYADGTQRRQYWCRKTPHGIGCGRLTVEQRWADAMVGEMVMRHLGDPRHADRLASRLAASRGQRAKLNAEVDRLNGDADALAGKVAAWGVDRVDKAMRPIDERLAVLQKQLATLDDPESKGAAAADTVRDWEQGSTVDRRAMVRRAFPKLTLKPATSRGAASLTKDRLDWHGASLPATHP
jgi:hypothetical protein